MALYKPGESGNPQGRPRGSKNQNPFRQRVGEVLDGHLTVENLNKSLDQLEPKDRVNAILRLLEFALPKLRSIEASIETREEDKSQIDLGRLTKEQRASFYELYNLAKIKPNGQANEVDQVKTQDNV